MKLSPHPFTLRQLQYIAAVARLQSFRKAADACHVSQPSLSAQVAQVEDALGVVLFDRDTRRTALTRAGTELVPRLVALLDHADDLADAARLLSDPLSGTLKLGVIPTMGPYLLPLLAPALRKSFPRLTVLWTEDKTSVLARSIREGTLDAAVVALESELGSVDHVVLGADPLVLAVPPGHALSRGSGPVAASELEAESVLLLDDGHCFREQVLDLCTRTGAHEHAFRATSLGTLVQVAAASGVPTLLPAMSRDVENRAGTLVVRPLGPPPPTRTVALAWRQGSLLSTTCRTVGALLEQAYATMAAPAPASAPRRRRVAG